MFDAEIHKAYLWLVGNGGMGYNYNYYYYHSSIGRAFHGKEGAEADDSAGDSEHQLHLL